MDEITLDDGFFNPYPKMKFRSKEEASTFWKVMFECEGGIWSLGVLFWDCLDKTPTTSFTKHENAFHMLYPQLERQVAFGLGKGAYKKYGVLKYTADFYDRKNNVIYEIDGNSHNWKLQQLKDEKRDLIFLIEFGIRTIRFSNHDIEKMILKRIREVDLVGKIYFESKR